MLTSRRNGRIILNNSYVLLAVILFSASLVLRFDRCSLTTVQANGYEYAYPESWIRDRIRGIEVILLHHHLATIMKQGLIAIL